MAVISPQTPAVFSCVKSRKANSSYKGSRSASRICVTLNLSSTAFMNCCLSGPMDCVSETKISTIMISFALIPCLPFFVASKIWRVSTAEMREIAASPWRARARSTGWKPHGSLLSDRPRYKKIVAEMNELEEYFVGAFLRTTKKAPGLLILDFDATDDPLHGKQEGRFFNGYYDCYCYLPLYVFCGDHLLWAQLRKADIDASDGAQKVLQRLVKLIRHRWPLAKILVRADSGFCRDALMSWCEANGVKYLFGLAKNRRLLKRITHTMKKARRDWAYSGRAARRFIQFSYRTRNSWSRPRRVVGKAEYMDKGENPRFVVTNLSRQEYEAQELYEKLYCARGEMENRIKEQQLYLFADRTSSATMRANQLRLWFSSLAYVILNELRSVGLRGTKMAEATCQSIRLKLLKIGAHVKVSVRRIVFSMASGYPDQDLFQSVLLNLQRTYRLKC